MGWRYFTSNWAKPGQLLVELDCRYFSGLIPIPAHSVRFHQPPVCPLTRHSLLAIGLKVRLRLLSGSVKDGAAPFVLLCR